MYRLFHKQTLAIDRRTKPGLTNKLNLSANTYCDHFSARSPTRGSLNFSP